MSLRHLILLLTAGAMTAPWLVILLAASHLLGFPVGLGFATLFVLTIGVLSYGVCALLQGAEPPSGPARYGSRWRPTSHGGLALGNRRLAKHYRPVTGETAIKHR